MFRPVPLLLILAVMLTSIGLGAARGTVRQGTEVVLCTGHGVVVTRLPESGNAQARICPDMALSLLAVIGMPEPALPLRAPLPQPGPPVLIAGTAPVLATVIRVRGPPVPHPA
nr:hypothetical protein [Paracoccus saliphilus]